MGTITSVKSIYKNVRWSSRARYVRRVRRRETRAGAAAGGVQRGHFVRVGHLARVRHFVQGRRFPELGPRPGRRRGVAWRGPCAPQHSQSAPRTLAPRRRIATPELGSMP